MKSFTRNECLQSIGTLDAIIDRLAESEKLNSRARERLAADATIYRDKATEARDVIQFLINELDKRALRKDRLSEWSNADDQHPFTGNEA